MIEEKAPKPIPPAPGKNTSSFSGFESSEAELQIHELQDLEEHIGQLNSLLSGCDMRVVVKIRAKVEAKEKSEAVAELLEKIKEGWGAADV